MYNINLKYNERERTLRLEIDTKRCELVGVDSEGRKVRRFYPSLAVLFGAVSARCGFATCFSRSLATLYDQDYASEFFDIFLRDQDKNII